MSISNIPDVLISSIIAATVSFFVTFASIYTTQQIILDRLETIQADVKQIKHDFYRPLNHEPEKNN